MPQFPSELPYWALLRYAVRGQGDVSRKSNAACKKIKRGDSAYIARVAERVRENIAMGGVLSPCFAGRPFLVPAPRSAPLVKGGLWPAAEICRALVSAGIGAEVLPCLERWKRVTKAATAPAQERPTPELHYETVRVGGRVLASHPDALVLVDDVVTRGATLVGLIPHLEEAFPGVDIRCFAVCRTVSEGDIAEILDPVEGRIHGGPDRLRRAP